MSKSSRLTVLHVEDSDDDAMLIEMALDMASAEWRKLVNLHRVSTIKQAWKFVRANRPHLVLLDLNLESESGYDFLRALKSDPNYTSIPVLVLSTSDAAGDVLAAYQRQAASYIVKPAKFVRLVEKMTSLHLFWVESAELP